MKFHCRFALLFHLSIPSIPSGFVFAHICLTHVKKCSFIMKDWSHKFDLGWYITRHMVIFIVYYFYTNTLLLAKYGSILLGQFDFLNQHYTNSMQFVLNISLMQTQRCNKIFWWYFDTKFEVLFEVLLHPCISPLLSLLCPN